MTNRLYTAVMSNEVIHGKTDTVLQEQGLGRCIFERGWGNGYVLVPPCHPCHGKSYDELHDIAVHGGLTFSSAMDNEHVTSMQWAFLDGVPENLEDYWAFGFDTNHYRDNAREHTLLYVVQETNSLKQQLEDYDTRQHC